MSMITDRRKCYGINIKAKDTVWKSKGRDVLDINELEVYDYNRIGLVGANGAGKEHFTQGTFRRINSQDVNESSG